MHKKRYRPHSPNNETGPLNEDWVRIGWIRGVNQPIPKTIHSSKKSLNDIALKISTNQDQIKS
jgi:hypothetical protein